MLALLILIVYTIKFQLGVFNKIDINSSIDLLFEIDELIIFLTDLY